MCASALYLKHQKWENLVVLNGIFFTTKLKIDARDFGYKNDLSSSSSSSSSSVVEVVVVVVVVVVVIVVTVVVVVIVIHHHQKKIPNKNQSKK